MFSILFTTEIPLFSTWQILLQQGEGTEKELVHSSEHSPIDPLPGRCCSSNKATRSLDQAATSLWR